jgi:hypothetical protein
MLLAETMEKAEPGLGLFFSPGGSIDRDRYPVFGVRVPGKTAWHFFLVHLDTYARRKHELPKTTQEVDRIKRSSPNRFLKGRGRSNSQEIQEDDQEN